MNSIIPRKMTKREMQALEGSIRKQIAKGVGNLKGNI